MKKTLLILLSSMLLVVVILIVILFLNKKEVPNYDHLSPSIYPKREIYSIDMMMVGDALYHYDTYTDGKNRNNNSYNYEYQLEYIKPIIDNYDLAFYNQESILGGNSLGFSSYPRFNTPSQVGDAFVDAGFNVVSLANNHTLDKNEMGVINSINYWKTKDVVTAGSYASSEDRNDIKIHSKNNINYVFLSYTTTTNGLSAPKGKEYLVNTYSYDKVKNDIEKIKDKTDIILVSMHWGVEYQHTPSNRQVQIANELSSLGVDVVIGHHPHVVQPIEQINDTVVFYSLGNFISGQIGIERLIGLLGGIRIEKEIIDDKIVDVSIKKISGDLVYTYKNKYSKNYKIYPFALLTNNILPNYEKIKNTYEGYLNIKANPNISIGKLKIDKEK